MASRSWVGVMVLVPVLACGETRGNAVAGAAGTTSTPGEAAGGLSSEPGSNMAGALAAGGSANEAGRASLPETSSAGAGGVAETTVGDAGAAGADSPAEPLELAWAHWPMPNTVASGLPHPMSYDTSVDGVVKDLVTGLEWQRDDTLEVYSFMAAQHACDALSLGGHTDWRLPGRIELVSLQAYGTEALAVPQVFPGHGAVRDRYWSSSIQLQTGDVWTVLDFYEDVGVVGVAETHPVRCVRAPKQVGTPPPHYTVKSSVVTDNWTGLDWEQAPADQWVTLEEQRSRCDALVLGGHADWRLPSLKELLTLVDERKNWPALDADAFAGKDSIESGWYWSATEFPPLEGHAPSVAGVDFADGSVRDQPLTFPLLARCVR